MKKLILFLTILSLCACIHGKEYHTKVANVVIFANTLPNVEFTVVDTELLRARSDGQLESIVREKAVRKGANAVKLGSGSIVHGMVFSVNEVFVTYIYFEPTVENKAIINKHWEEQQRQQSQ